MTDNRHRRLTDEAVIDELTRESTIEEQIVMLAHFEGDDILLAHGHKPRADGTFSDEDNQFLWDLLYARLSQRFLL